MAKSIETGARRSPLLEGAATLIERMRRGKNFDEGVSIGYETTPSVEGKRQRLQFFEADVPFLSASAPAEKDLSTFAGNIENFIGMTQIPTGLAGPFRVIGSCVDGDVVIPLATTEGALVSSYHRGARVSRLAGGIHSLCLLEAVQRSPGFRFKNLADLGQFLVWTLGQREMCNAITAEVSRHAKLLDVTANVEGNQLTLTFEFQTGDAAGQNMVTLCTDAICQKLLALAPIAPEVWYIESNFSGDKKATSRSFGSVRGKKVVSEIEVPASIVRDVLHTSADRMAQYWQTSTLGVIQSGAIGAQGHVANGLCALFMATGQDVACVSEASVGITRMEARAGGALYASVTLPNLIIGTVGGGTMLPTQLECLRMMGCDGANKARRLAEITGALAVAGELSIAAALSEGHFASAHRRLGRKKHVEEAQ